MDFEAVGFKRPVSSDGRVTCTVSLQSCVVKFSKSSVN